MRRFKVLTLMIGMSLLSLPALSGGAGLPIDEVIVQYPAGFTKVLVMDVAPFLTTPELEEGVIGPLIGMNHPLAGPVRTLQLFQIPPEQVEFIAHGEGPEVTSFTLIAGPSFAQTFGALQGLRAAAGAPNSPFTHWDIETIDGLPVVFIGGTFGPVAIEWAYIPLEGALWVGTEVAFLPGQPDAERLKATTEKVIARLLGKPGTGYFDELHIAVQVRGGQVAFVRKSLDGERPLEPGEQAMGFTLSLTGTDVNGKFALRFDSVAAAAAAAERLQQGTSPYLAQDLYQAQLVGLQQNGRVLTVEIATDPRGLVGLLQLIMPF
jgi:hypothetical protein